MGVAAPVNARMVALVSEAEAGTLPALSGAEMLRLLSAARA